MGNVRWKCDLVIIVLIFLGKTDAGAVDEDIFLKTFEDVHPVQIFSNRELTEQMNNIKDIISDSSKDWNKRVEAVSE